MRSFDYEIWDIVMEGPYVPTKSKGINQELEPKPKDEWTDVELKKFK